MGCGASSTMAPPAARMESPPAPKVVGGIRIITAEELAKHTSREDCWMAIHDRVYDLTTFMPTHPGSMEVMTEYAGNIADLGFDMVHDEGVLSSSLKPDSFMGILAGSATESKLQAGEKLSLPWASPAPTASSTERADAPVASFLRPQPQAVKLVSREELSPSVVHLRFELLPDTTADLGLRPGKHLRIHAPASDDEVAVERKFTPAVLLRGDGEGLASTTEHVGAFDLIVRVFAAGDSPDFPEGGRVSQHIGRQLAIGDTIPVSGPFGLHEYVGGGTFETGPAEGQRARLSAKRVGLLAGSTGLPPLVAVVAAALADPSDSTSFSLLSHTPSEETILMRSTLDFLARAHPARLKLWHAVDAVDDEKAWPYSTGELTEALLAEHLPPPRPSDDDGGGASEEPPLILMCGPDAPLVQLWQQHLDKLGFAPERRLVF